MRRRSKWRSALFFAVFALTAGHARADDPNRVAAATLLFDEGVRALDAGRLDEACQKLAKSQELAPSGGTLLALGECHERAGRHASAWVAYRGAASRAAAAGRADAEASALEHAAQLEPKLARLTIKVSAKNGANLELLRDSGAVTREEIDVAVPVDPGRHEIQASAPGMKRWTKQIQVSAGSTVTVEVPPLEPAKPTSSGESPTAGEEAGRTQRIVGITAAGVGGGALIGGTIFGLLAMSANNQGEEGCSATVCTRESNQLLQQASDRATISTVLFVAGVVLVAGGGVLYFTAPAPAPRKGAYLDWSTGTYHW